MCLCLTRICRDLASDLCDIGLLQDQFNICSKPSVHCISAPLGYVQSHACCHSDLLLMHGSSIYMQALRWTSSARQRAACAAAASKPTAPIRLPPKTGVIDWASIRVSSLSHVTMPDRLLHVLDHVACVYSLVITTWSKSLMLALRCSDRADSVNLALVIDLSYLRWRTPLRSMLVHRSSAVCTIFGCMT